MEFVQSAGEAVYLPHGVAHSVLNLRDNVAVTENFLFVDGLPELMSKIALDEISDFRPGWDEQAVKKLYYGGLVSARDRDAMRRAYEHAVRRVTQVRHFLFKKDGKNVPPYFLRSPTSAKSPNPRARTSSSLSSARRRPSTSDTDHSQGRSCQSRCQPQAVGKTPLPPSPGPWEGQPQRSGQNFLSTMRTLKIFSG